MEEQKPEVIYSANRRSWGGERCASRRTGLESVVIVPAGLSGVDRPSVQLVPVRRYFPFAFAALSLAFANRI
jgi:hypothetical protein